MQESIAIVGSACRFPGGANSPSKLWELLNHPRDVLSDVSANRFNLARFYHINGEHHGSTDVKGQSYLLSAEEYRAFDASFFRFNPVEAEATDPQQRILLETVYEALEAAGCKLDQVQGTSTAVFVGSMTADWNDIQLRDTETLPTYTATGSARSILSNRISYFFDLKGPSMTIDTACSSSLVALHQAVQSLRRGESQSAIVAGVNLILDPSLYIFESKLHMLSPTSRSRMWDKSADGYARGEGCAAIILKPLRQALKDSDHIQCIIRETGVNSDGRTKGITMPSPVSQAALIRATYRAAGLDPLVDRCQYFEGHGTGTLAGDPVEAEAIHEAFFLPDDAAHEQRLQPEQDCKLFVGSIKTVIGHLEGCAGLAGVLKASLAIQNKVIPPNMHFKELNPEIERFYNNLQVVTESMPWPEVAGHPRRASVNSFGFGGTNAHAIIESYEQESDPNHISNTNVGYREQLEQAIAWPLVFSANTESSLRNILKDFTEYIRRNPSVNLNDLSWTSQCKRSVFPARASVTGATHERLVAAMLNLTEKGNSGVSVGIRANPTNPSEVPGMLGIFTGQGAQWATMGRGLMVTCPLFEHSIKQCERALASLPEPPAWSLCQELIAEGAASHLSEAAISQPLCTAIQLATVDLLRAAGVSFDAVLGHSSGEIAATYAAGILSLKDAVRIAYYRGLHARSARGPDGQKGAMMAVSLPFTKAEAFCKSTQFYGRLSIAAYNSPSSVTLSGDLDAINEAKQALDEERTFARLLKVDTAYHSHHMHPCAEAYLQSLRSCNIQVHPPGEGCIWISSVRGDVDLVEEADLQALTGQYWVDNMLKPVLFHHAVECSLWNGGPFDVVIEVGPHPALKGPATQVFKSALGSSLPYYGCMHRGENENESFSQALGFIWSHLGPSFVDFEGYRTAFQCSYKSRMLKDLPSYSWDHDKVYWKESRMSRNFRLRSQPPHELLGRRAPDDSEYEMRWRNIFRLGELPWLKGHSFQGQAIFPAAGYVSMTVESATAVAKNAPIKLIEIQDMSIHRALVLEEDHTGVETVFNVKLDNRKGLQKGVAVLHAEFACYICPDEGMGSFELGCSGQLYVHLGQSCGGELPLKPRSPSQLAAVDIDRFYSSLSNIGLNYEGLFHTMKSASRTSGYATVSALWPEDDLSREYILHPALLDVGFQASVAAFASPATDALWTTYLPTKIRRLIVDTGVSYRESTGDVKLGIDAFITKSSSTVIEADVHLSGPDGQYTGVQVEGLSLKSITEPRPSDDRLVFAETVWDMDVSSCLAEHDAGSHKEEESTIVDAIERTALYYLRNLLTKIAPGEIPTLTWYHQLLLEACNTFLTRMCQGQHPVVKKEWLGDSHEVVTNLRNAFPGQADLELLRVTGENLVSVVRGETQLLEVMMENDLLNRFYMEGHGFGKLNTYVARVMGQITHKYPRTRILEIGAGTGGTTKSILDTIEDAYAAYIYTDISSGFFEKASEKFKDRRKMTFKVLDVEKEVAAQGFQENGYDVVVAANVLHATRTLSETLRHTRSLLCPGGYLVLVEVTGDLLRMPLLMGGLPGWWLGADEGRRLGPGISPSEWNELLQSSGFSGVETIFYDMPDVAKHSCSVIVSQAVDEKCELFRDPLSAIHMLPMEEPLLILGGSTLSVSKIVRTTQRRLSSTNKDITVVNNLENLNTKAVAPGSSVICLLELDTPFFSESLTATKLKTLQSILSTCRNILWVTAGRLSASPSSNMIVGIGRALLTELPHVDFQFLNFTEHSGANANVIMEAYIRLALSSLPTYRDHDMLWTTEPEVEFNGVAALIPRVVPDKYRNDRYNASRRIVTKKLTAHEGCVEVITHEGALQLVQRDLTLRSSSGPVTHRVDVKYSTTLHSKDQQNYFLCMGALVGLEQEVVALSMTDGSTIEVLSENVCVLEKEDTCTPSTLVSLAGQVLATAILSSVPPTGRTLIYEAELHLYQAIMLHPEWRQRDILFASSSPRSLPNWLSIHPRASERYIKEVLPRDLACVIDFSNSGSGNVISYLRREYYLLPFDASMRGSLLPSCQSHLLRQAYTKALAENRMDPKQINSVQDLATSLPSSRHYPNVVDWSEYRNGSVMVEPLNTCGLYSADKTYFLVGMTGELGRSICRQMVKDGARHVVLTSRHADIDTAWLDEMAGLGARIKVYKMDVSDKGSLRSTVAAIRETMPPIGGVCNAALVLEDRLFVDTNVDIIKSQLRPKVDGTKYLDELFSHEPLDFFILFSSLGSIIGNAGQSIYHAANLYMTSLAAQRRKRGLAASIIHVGMVTEIGYVARAGRHIEEHLRKMFNLPLSESDVHHLFAEAVLASHPESEGGAEIIMGIEPFIDSPDATIRPPWYTNPRFSHLVREESASTEQIKARSSTTLLRETLEGSRSEDEATAALLELFSAKLASILQLAPDTINTKMSLLDLGCDSLVAVEIRTWFLKDIHVDIPVLKILGQDTVSDICTEAARKFLHSMSGAAVPSKEGPPVTERANPNSDEKDQPTAANVEIPDNDNSTGSDFASRPGNSNDSNSSRIADGSTTPLSGSSISAGEKTVASPPLEGPVKHLADIKPFSLNDFTRVEKLSYAQSRIWFMHKYLEDPTTYNITVSYEVKGDLQPSRFEHALTTVVARHDALHTAFFCHPDTGDLMQGILPASVPSFKHIESSDEEEGNRAFSKLKSHVYDLERGQTFRAILITRAPHLHAVIFGYHHIAMDGVSWGLFLRDLDLAYRIAPPRPVPKHYAEFVIEETHSAKTGEFNDQISFWQREHAPLPDTLQLLPFSRVRSRRILKGHESHTVSKTLDVGTVNKIREISRELRVTPFHFYLTVMQVMFSRFLDVDDICIGVTDANRTDASFADTIGFFVNVLPLRLRMDHNSRFGDTVRTTSHKVMAAYANAIPFDLILDRLNVPRSASHSPLFQIALNYRTGDTVHVPCGNCQMNFLSTEDAKSPYDLAFNITQTSRGTCILQITARDYLYTQASSNLLMNIYSYMLETFSGDGYLALNDCHLFDTVEAGRALAVGCGPRMSFDWPPTITERLDVVHKQYGDSIAIKDDTEAITYAQLEQRINSIAAAIMESGVSMGSRVAVLCHPSADGISCMLAILRIGCIYIPLDLSLGEARHATILHGCKPALLLYHSPTETLAQTYCIAAPEIAIISVSGLSDAAYVPIGSSAGSRQPAFLLYTSGSTGTPKGILLSQAGYMNYAASKGRRLSLGQERVLQQSSSGFDMAIAQVFNALANGGTLVIVPQKIRGDPLSIARLMLKENISFTTATPSEYLMLLRYGGEFLKQYHGWRHACLGGEAVTEQLKEEFRNLGNPDLVLTDCYGPTEISAATSFETVSLAADLDDCDDFHSVGKPIPNTSIYILDKSGRPVPNGFPGEICVRGVGVALGYLDPELNGAKFVRSPFVTERDSDTATKMYKTGDKGKLLEDGSLVFMGRMDGDSQVKLRGLRIELDEVSKVLVKAAQGVLSDAIVSVQGGPESLVAHVIFAPGKLMSAAELRILARNLPLPQYMCPSMVIPVERFPTTANGKVDRQALEYLTPAIEDSGPVQPRLTLSEGELRLMWQDVLRQTARPADIGPESDFFMLGGNSLLLVRLQAAIRERMVVEIPLTDLYQASTLSRMALRVSASRTEQLENQGTIDWESETAVSDDMLELATILREGTKQIGKERREVLLTGSTSFLGSAILNHLIHNTNVQKVHCVAVHIDEQKRLLDSAKIICYTGSLLHPTLGLSQEACERLQLSVDQIIHAGATGHCLNNYSSIRASNYLSTRFLAKLALPRHIDLHFISSNRVTLLSGNTSLPPISVASYPPPGDGSEGFTASKWASEKFLESLSGKTQLPVCIHRPCAGVGDNAPSEDALNALLRFSILMRAVPQLENVEGYLDFKEVQAVAAEIATCSPTLEETPFLRIRHHSSGIRVLVSDLAGRMEAIYGGSFERLSLEDWLRKATERGIEPLIVSYLSALVHKGETMLFPFLGET
jgi:amino acid adenylation domain-containing protein